MTAATQQAGSARLLIERGHAPDISPYRSSPSEVRRLRIRYRPNWWWSALAVGIYPLLYVLRHWHGLTVLEILLVVCGFSVPGVCVMIARTPALRMRTILVDHADLVVLMGARRKVVERVDLADIRDVVATGANRRDQSIILVLTDGRTIRVLTGLDHEEAPAVRAAVRECLVPTEAREQPSEVASSIAAGRGVCVSWDDLEPPSADPIHSEVPPIEREDSRRG